MLVDLKELKNTPDDQLLERFPGYTRNVLRELKRGSYKKPKILVFDIETSPIEALVWNVWDENIQPDRLLKDWNVICWSAKWLDGSRMFSDRLTSKEAIAGDDKRIVKSLRDMLDEADIVVAHNGDKFDIRKIQTRFLFHNMPFPSAYESFDTLKVCRREFGITYNKLDYVCSFLGLKGKMSTGGQELWNSCRLGNVQSLLKMSRYCDNDVRILESLFKRLIPYIRTNPKKWGVLQKYAL